MASLLQSLTDLIPTRMMDSSTKRSQTRRLWWHLYEAVQPGGLFRVPVGNYRMFVNTADAIIGHCLLKHGVFEPRESELLRALLRPGDTFIDCGANIGYYTLLAAAAVGPQGHVYSFEPVPDNYMILEKNIVSNGLAGFVRSWNLALGEVATRAPIYVDSANYGAHSMHAANVPEITKSISVEVRRLDELVDGPRVDLIKLDTQGAELSILKGASKLLSQHQPLLAMEWWPWGLEAGGGNAAALAELLLSFGYRAAVLSADSPTRAVVTDWDQILQEFPASDPEAVPTLLCASAEKFQMQATWIQAASSG